MIKRLMILAVLVSMTKLGFGQHVIKGKVKNERGIVPGAEVRLLQTDGEMLAEVRTDMDGLYNLEVKDAGEYILEINQGGHEMGVFKANVSEESEVIEKNFMLQPEDKLVYRIPDMYFFPEEANLTDHGKEMIYKMGQILKNMPHVKIELVPETSGFEAQEQSDKKEMAVKKYLLKTGVTKKRFVTAEKVKS